MPPSSPSLDALRAAIDLELARFLDERRAALPDAGVLLDEIDRLVRAGGKRLRPSFCYWGYRAAGRPHGDAIVRAASSLELLHTFAIVHDDVMDAADERRGEPTVHVVHDVNVALLVGDLALVLADALFVGAGFAPGRVTDAFDAYSRMRQEVIAGQYLDLVAAARSDVSEDEARWIAVLKSGRYTVEEPLAIGAALAGAAPPTRAALGRFGEPLGEAFQLRDDLLGTFGERSSVGKPVDSDIREGKRHLLYAKTVALLDGRERDWFVRRWGAGDDLGDDDVARLRALIERSGARRDTEALLAAQTGAACAALDDAPVADGARAALLELARSATARAS
ncbi:MAG TPA: polyprenyl synthetase family protein [Actinomycetota bacterium]|nr:polyprenyl synthetase family protein [Actinomycetota bacterium]